ncbi:MAG TPA: hypothetical protein VLM89_08705 [Phycisphaerae bacterium]|nr:hypothetical protein [Phycisphaerae bacterium]
MRATLYSIAVPLMFLFTPLMGVSASELGDYLKGTEFRTFIGEIFIQIIGGIVNAFIIGLTTLLFGA